jgi:hypothetical protein
MQGARTANIPAIFNRRATPQDGMHRFPNADVFVGRTLATETRDERAKQGSQRSSSRRCVLYNGLVLDFTAGVRCAVRNNAEAHNLEATTPGSHDLRYC